MPANRLLEYPEGERLSLLHYAIREKTEQLGQSALALRAMPELLQAEKTELEERMQQMVEAEAERLRLAAENDMNSPENIALQALAAARAECESKDEELRRMQLMLDTTRQELHAMGEDRRELKRMLEAEKAELHKLRQQDRTTQLPQRIISDKPKHASPRQREHPELTSPRQAERQQERAASATARRDKGSARAAVPQRPRSARPVMGEHSSMDFGRTPYAPRDAASAMVAGASTAAMAAALQQPMQHRIAPPRRPGDSPRDGAESANAAVAPGGSRVGPRGASVRMAATGCAGETSAEAGVGPSRADLERQLRDLQRANARLQTALHAVALDPGGSADLGGLLTAVDSGLTIRRTLSRGHGPAGDEPLRPWGIPAHISKLPKGQVLPRGFVMWPPPMA